MDAFNGWRKPFRASGNAYHFFAKPTRKKLKLAVARERVQGLPAGLPLFWQGLPKKNYAYRFGLHAFRGTLDPYHFFGKPADFLAGVERRAERLPGRAERLQLDWQAFPGIVQAQRSEAEPCRAASDGLPFEPEAYDAERNAWSSMSRRTSSSETLRRSLRIGKNGVELKKRAEACANTPPPD